MMADLNRCISGPIHPVDPVNPVKRISIDRGLGVPGGKKMFVLLRRDILARHFAVNPLQQAS